ncbi:MAG: methylenetetrahydrofolate reductase [Chloroflexota bacterium]|nr:methylenetetrahydrofolate reductase [Dehalococcoidia bacterium]MDW8252723.1 methylenetetrahydrofolate reductase [Chloroflexota bacterium]
MSAEVVSRFACRLKAGAFVVTGELSPPRSGDASLFRRRLAEARAVVDAVNITDNPGASVHASPLAGAAIALQEGVEPIVQLVCRDRNRLALQSDLIGAWLLGVRAVMAMTGDPVTAGDHPTAKAVFDLDSFGLIRLIARMRAGELDNGRPLPAPPRFVIGGAEAPFAGPISSTVDRLERKVEAGVEFIQTQFVWEADRFADWMAEVRRRGLHQRVAILPGVGVLRSAASARWLGDHLGQPVPPAIIGQLEAAGPTDGAQVGASIAAALINRLRAIEGVAGVHLLPVAWPAGLRAAVEAAGLLPTPSSSASLDTPPRRG